ncbi:MAG: mercuric transporter MerT family protein [Candidatus Binatia bacterium]
MNSKTPQKNGWGLFAAAAAAVAASACCLGPLVLVALGASGAWIGSLGALEAYRPFFVVLTVGLLGSAFYRAYRPQPEACEQGSACSASSTKKLTRLSLWLVTVLVLGLFISPYVVGRLAAGTDTTRPAATETVALEVAGMTCSTCPATVRMSLERLDGVLDARVTFNPPRASVEIDPAKLTPKDLTDATASVGYPSRVTTN